MTHEHLPEIFIGGGEVKGFQFTQVKNTEEGYIYKVSAYGKEYYEVFRANQVPVCLDFDNRIYSSHSTKDTYPKANSFGVWAWTCNSLKQAEEKLADLKNKSE